MQAILGVCSGARACSADATALFDSRWPRTSARNSRAQRTTCRRPPSPPGRAACNPSVLLSGACRAPAWSPAGRCARRARARGGAPPRASTLPRSPGGATGARPAAAAPGARRAVLADGAAPCCFMLLASCAAPDAAALWSAAAAGDDWLPAPAARLGLGCGPHGLVAAWRCAAAGAGRPAGSLSAVASELAGWRLRRAAALRRKPPSCVCSCAAGAPTGAPAARGGGRERRAVEKRQYLDHETFVR